MFSRRKRNKHEDDWEWGDDDWDLDDDDWLLEEDDHTSSSPKILIAIAGLFVIVLCAGAWFSRSAWLPAGNTPDHVIVLSPTASPAAEQNITEPSSPSSPIVEPQSAAGEYDPNALAASMLALINADRAANGLTAVAWDETAATAGAFHAADMVQYNYFSHWNQDGLGPEHRYAQAGGQDAVTENLHAFSHTYDDGRAAPIENWQEVIQNAQTGLMNSPGHRANILDPAHTHVGIGMAYNPETGQFRLAQEFTNRYAQLNQPIPAQAALGDEIVVNGRIPNNSISNILLDLAYGPFPAPMSLSELNATSTYSSRANSIYTIPIPAEFDERVTIDAAGQPGYYHIRIFGDLSAGQALLMERIITVP